MKQRATATTSTVHTVNVYTAGGLW